MRFHPVGLVGIVLITATSMASARTVSESGYSRTQTFNGALRFVRVDNGYELVEQDREAGYLLFKYASPSTGELSNGSIEVLEVGQEVKIVVQLPKMPEYHERVLSDSLLRKLKDEYGEPPREKAPKVRKAPEKPDPNDPKGGKKSPGAGGDVKRIRVGDD